MSTFSRVLRGALTVSLLTTLAVPLAAAPSQAIAPTGVTTLVAPPAGETVGGNPTFTWTAVPGAAKYRVQVSRSDLFDSTVYSVDTHNVHATPPTALPVGQLYWRVAPTDGSSGVGTYVSSTFTRVWSEAPSLSSPAHEATLTYPDDPLLFTWDALVGAKTYNIQIDSEPEFVEPLVVSASTHNTSYTVADPQTNGQAFYWRVQGVADGVVSPWSEPRTYDVEWPAKPVLIAPSNTTVTDVVFQWSPVAGAASYDLEVSPNPDFANNVTIQTTVKSTRYSPPSTILNGSYFWRVRARDGKSVPNLGDWSSQIEVTPGELLPAQFTRAWNERPTLLGPLDGNLAVEVPTMSWTPVPYASHYEIWLGDDANFSPNTYTTCFTNQTTFTPYSLVSVPGQTNPAVPGICGITEGYIPVGEVVYWKVRGIDSPAGVNGLFSDPASFQLVHPDMVTLVAPEDSATTGRPVLTWEPVTGISRYKVTVLGPTGSNISGSPFTTFATSLTPNGLVAGSIYTWMVQTLDDAGRPGLAPHPLDRRQFVYQPEAATLSAPELVTPLLGEISVLMPSLQWEPVDGADSYHVWVGPQGANSVAKEGVTTMTAFTDMDVAKNPGTYEWYVDAYDKDTGYMSTSDLGSFTIIRIELATPTSPVKCVLDTCTASSETPKLTWDPVEHAGGYLVYTANDASFTNMIRTYRTQYPTLTFRESYPDSVAGQAYYWFVRPCRSASAGGGCGPFDNNTFPTAGAFRKRSLGVTLLSPANNATVPATGTQPQDITFTWEEFAQTNAANVPPSGQGARRYRIQVWDVADLAKPTIDDQYVDQTTYTPWDKTYPEGTLYWRVSAIDGSNQQLTYSPVWQVEKKTPPLAVISPDPGSTQAGTPYFQWTPQPGTSRYDVEVYKNGDTLFSAVNKLTALTGTAPKLTAYTPTTSLPQGVYAWRVRRVDNGNRPGPWTSGGTFTLAQTAPTLVSPGDGTVLSAMDVVFAWTGVPKAAQYRYEVSTTSSFTAIIEAANTVMTSWAPVAKYPDGQLYWRVKVLDAAGNALATSATGTFRKDSVVPTVTSKTPTTNAPLTGGAFTVNFSEPVKGLSTSTFTMKVFGTTTSVPGTVTPGATTMTSTASFKPSATLIPGETYTLSLSSGVVDANGNPLKPFSWNVRSVLAVDGNAPAVQYYWDRDTYTHASGGGYLASRTAGAKLTWTFTGTSYSIVGRRAPDGGYADVYVDGVRHGTASFHSGSHLWRQTVFSKTGLANKAHRLELRVLGTKPSSSSSTWVYPDAFRYGASQVEETHPSVVQAFRAVGHSGAYGRSYELNVHTASGDNGTQPYVLMRFRGTGVQWKGFRGTAGGLATVYIDGVARGTVDQYASTASTAGTTLWAVGGLSNAQHTIKIVLTGGKRAASTGYNVTVDSFLVI